MPPFCRIPDTQVTKCHRARRGCQGFNTWIEYLVAHGGQGMSLEELTESTEDLGYVPANITVRDTGSNDETSTVLVTEIRRLWDAHLLLLVESSPIQCCRVHLRKPREYWLGTERLTRFRAMLQECRDMRPYMEVRGRSRRR